MINFIYRIRSPELKALRCSTDPTIYDHKVHEPFYSYCVISVDVLNSKRFFCSVVPRYRYFSYGTVVYEKIYAMKNGTMHTSPRVEHLSNDRYGMNHHIIFFYKNVFYIK